MKSKPILSPAVRRFLTKPRLARLCTIGRDGYPHAVPIYFARVGDELIFGSDPDEAKVRNILREPRTAVVIGGEPEQDEAGYMIQGEASIEMYPSRKLVRRLVLRYEPKEEAERNLATWFENSSVLIRLKPRRVIRVW